MLWINKYQINLPFNRFHDIHQKKGKGLSSGDGVEKVSVP